MVISVKSSTTASDSSSSSRTNTTPSSTVGKDKKSSSSSGTKSSSQSGKVSKSGSIQENDDDHGSRSSDTINESGNINPMSSGFNVPLVIVANKSDLDECHRVVGTEMAECECIDWDCAFVESSAKSGDNIMSIFHKLLLQAHLKGILKSAAVAASSADHGVTSPSKLKVEKVPKVSNRRRSSLPVNDLFHSTARHLPLFGHKHKDIKEGESTDSTSGTMATSPTASSGGDHSSGRSSCALS